ncbi:MAG: site-2 protease family protein [Dehalococcoidia bacterium]|nr:site-2 protease family protein [Dehalococcoidia bacterium]MDW8120188.1 site-2 protease family protein [Chloroflexota bacterium]
MGGLRIGRILGIPIEVHVSWLFIFVLVVVSLSQVFGARVLFGVRLPSFSLPERWVLAVITAGLFFASVLAHELAHSIVALRRGIPVKGITLFVFGGVSQIAREAATPGVELVMAAVGPFVSLVLGGVFWGLAVFFAERQAHLFAITSYLAFANVLLGVFNMIPGFPLDGGRVMRAILWAVTRSYQRATGIAAGVGQGIGVLFILGGIVQALFVPAAFLSGVWIALIGWFLQGAAASSYRQLRLREGLKGFTARDLMAPECPRVAPSTSVQAVVDEYLLGRGVRCLLVSDDQRTYGLVTVHQVRQVPRERWAYTPVREAMTPLERVVTVSPQEDAYRVLEVLDEAGVNQVPVVQNGQVVGLISREQVIHFLRVREELGV